MIEAARPAEPADLLAVAELHRAATEELTAERGGALWARERGRSEPPAFDLDDDAQLLLAGTLDDAILGYARVEARPLPGGGELAVLTDVYVDPGARGVGLGELLLTQAVEWAMGRGCVGIDSIALPGMRETKNFFEAAGMVARAIVVHRSFG